MTDLRPALHEEIDALPDGAVRQVLEYVRHIKHAGHESPPETPPGQKVGMMNDRLQPDQNTTGMQSLSRSDPRSILTLSLEEREQALASAADKVAEFYQPGSALMEWTDAFVDDLLDDA